MKIHINLNHWVIVYVLFECLGFWFREFIFSPIVLCTRICTTTLTSLHIKHIGEVSIQINSNINPNIGSIYNTHFHKKYYYFYSFLSWASYY